MKLPAFIFGAKTEAKTVNIAIKTNRVNQV